MKKLSRQRGPYSGGHDRRQPRFSRELSVLYEDDAIIALNKPAKLLAVPAENSSTPSALSLLSAELRHKRQRAFVVHRIDRYTRRESCCSPRPGRIARRWCGSFLNILR